jgi:DNA-binding NarL/FixJ family response regulator
MTDQERAGSAKPRRLTPRELVVLEHIMKGASNKEIALELGCAVKTVEFHVANLLRKYTVPSRIHLVLKLAGTVRQTYDEGP